MVVEDLVYIDDLQALIYTTVAPRTSKIFITSLEKSKSSADDDPFAALQAQEKNYLTLHDLTEKSREEKAKLAAKM